MTNLSSGWRLNAESSGGLGTALAIACACIACGCSDESYRLGGGGLRSGIYGRCEDGAEAELIDSMEDGDGAIEEIAGRGGVWISFNDKTGGSQQPSPEDETFMMAEVDPTEARGRYAVRSKGQGFTVWGAGIGFELDNQKAYDLSRYAGIAFKARRSPRGDSHLRFSLPDPATTPRGMQCTECNDHFGVDVELTPKFSSFQYLWREFKQVGSFGEPKKQALDVEHVYGVRFQADKNAEFDFWIDDVALLCRE